jgi:DNA-binding transcriptional ArsR family regulator
LGREQLKPVGFFPTAQVFKIGVLMGKSNTYPEITWDIGTAYDFFISLRILHDPADYGLRPAWASGMRQRLPTRDREVLETFHSNLVISPPFKWINSIPEPKDGAITLKTAQNLPPFERICALIGLAEEDPDVGEIIRQIILAGKWHDDELNDVMLIYKAKYGKSKNVKSLKTKFEHWANATTLSDEILKALQTYYEVFFADEERRIIPALQRGLIHAQELSGSYNLLELLEELSQGVRYRDENFQDHDQLILAPSFWASPFVFYSSQKPVIFLFGARPENASLIPGELVPDALMSSLNALSDPTRLRILRYLSSESLTPTQLATRLRLRTPTVIHHIKSLRSAGLVYVIPGPKKKEIHYQTRTERLSLVCEMLKQFVG